MRRHRSRVAFEMRALCLLSLAACTNEPSAAPAPPAPPPPAPAVAPKYVAAPPHVVIDTPDAKLAMQAKCPVGDMTNVDVYSFIEREITESTQNAKSTNNTRDLVKREAELEKQPDMKPMRASIVEGELSHVLSTLCRGTPGCKAIGLYDKSGLAFALSSNSTTIAPLGFVDAVWPKLVLGAQRGLVREFDGEMYVIFPVEKRGVALCVVEK
jgi:hypothetical protein